MLQRARLAAIVLVALLVAGSASAEIVFFTTGRTMKAQGHRDQGDRIALLLPGGGEIVCERAMIDHIAPDEVPPEEPAPVVPVTMDPALAVPAEYARVIDAAAARHGVDAKLVRAVIQVESAYQSRARSRKGAMGLMQLMPDTARRFAVANPYDPVANIEGGVKYLKWLLDRFGVDLAVAAYNAGEAAVERFGGIPPYAETRTYVQAVLKLAGAAASVPSLRAGS